MLNVSAPTFEKMVNWAIHQFKEGNYEQAEGACRAVLDVLPWHVGALTLMAAMGIQARQFEVAETFARAALEVDPTHAEGLYQLGFAYAAGGKLNDAEKSYRQATELQTDYVEAMFSLGLTLRKLGRSEEAVPVLQKLTELRPKSERAFNELGSALKDVGKVEEGIEAYRTAVTLKPEYWEAFYNLGVAFSELRRAKEAIAAYQLALRIKPEFPEALANLASAMEAVGRLNEAVDFYEESLKLSPNHEDTMFHYAMALMKAQRWRRAVEAFQSLTSFNNQRADAFHALALAWRGVGEIEEAIKACRMGAELPETYAAVPLTLGVLLNLAGRKEEAAAVLEKAIEKYPDSLELKFELAMLTGKTTMNKLPPAAVHTLFENYAPNFEDHLVKKLQYRGPEQLMEAIRAVRGEGLADERFDILDLGCGTGLCGELFKPLAKKLIGVDLAAGMVTRAQARGVYDEVVQGELVATMQGNATQFDLVLAGDVFEYIGDLNDVFAAAKKTMRAGGLFAFTAEKSDTTEMTFRSTVRFAHSLEYLRAVSERHGFAEAYVAEQPLRTEKEKPLLAWVMVLRKPMDA